MDAEDPYSKWFKKFNLRCLISPHISKVNLTKNPNILCRTQNDPNLSGIITFPFIE